MTTLTQDTALHPDHCPHKLPTSCRLTARLTCCACQDDRRHTPRYQKYIDGVGYVMLGTRQDGYCWPCKVFWNHRTSAAGMEPQDTRIPFIPDQTDFVNTWHDWHRGYRIIVDQNGHNTTIPLHGQPLRDVLIGELPVPLDDGDSMDDRAIHWLPRLQMPDQLIPAQEEPMEIPDEDNLFDFDNDNDMPATHPENQAEASQSHGDGAIVSEITTAHPVINQQNDPPVEDTRTLTAGEARNVRTLLRRLESLSSSVSSSSIRLQFILDLAGLAGSESQELRGQLQALKEIAEHVMQQSGDLTRHEALLRMLRSSSSIEPSNPPVTMESHSEAPDRVTSPSGEALVAPQLTQEHYRTSQVARQIRQQRNAAVAARQAAALGTREDVQEPTYESPINLMFNRATDYGLRVQRRRIEEEAMIAHQRTQNQRLQDITTVYVAMIEQMSCMVLFGDPRSLAPNSRIDFRPYDMISGGIFVDAQGSVEHEYHHEDPERLATGFSWEEDFVPLGKLLLRVLKANRPRQDHESQLTYEHVLWKSIALFLSELNDATPRMIGQRSVELERHFSAIGKFLITIFGSEATRDQSTPSVATWDDLGRLWVPQSDEFGMADSDSEQESEAVEPDRPQEERNSGGNIAERRAIQSHAMSPHLSPVSTGISGNSRLLDLRNLGTESIANMIKQENPQEEGERDVSYLDRLMREVHTFVLRVIDFVHTADPPPTIPPTDVRERRQLSSETSRSMVQGPMTRRPRGFPRRSWIAQQSWIQQLSPQALLPPQRPLDSTEMNVQLQCSICQEQVADIALVPCGHLVMCRWCSERQERVTGEWNGEGTGSTCPVCRTHIIQRLRIWGITGHVGNANLAGQSTTHDNDDSQDGGVVAG